MSGKLCCLICNTHSAVYLKNSKKIFGEFTTLQSEKQLSAVISEILDTPVKENELVSDTLCIKCYRLCIEYDLFHTKITKLKKSLQNEFKKSTFVRKETIGRFQEPKQVTRKKIVLPASKLQPLPPNYVLNVQNMANKGQFIQLSQNFCNSLSPQKSLPIITSIPSPMKTSTQINSSPAVSNAASVLKDMPKTTESIMTLNIGDLPQDFLTSAITKIEDAKSNSADDKNAEMEIDEDCSINMIRDTDDAANTSDPLSTEGDQIADNEHNYIALNVVTDRDEDNNELIFRELQIVNEMDETEDSHTLVINGNQVMNGNEASILQLVSGQKLMYGDKEISLVMPESQSNDDQDSNDESQIELQVSGDEETANAIIAAAQERGGAFIKVEGGEMFQVECIRSEDDTITTSKFDRTDAEIQSIIKLGENKMFTCLICEKNEFGDTNPDTYRGQAENMMMHLKIAHSARLYICAMCDLVVRRRNEYNRHLDEHIIRRDQSRYYECDTCGRKFVSKSLLREHMNIHSGVKPYSCAKCQKRFMSKYSLQAHIKTHLDRPRPFKCKQCGKAFMTGQNLAQHERIHSGIKEFICRSCGKAFGTQHNLEVHSVVHSGVKPYSCTMCDKAFARRAELADHTRVHTGERPFKCEVCGAAFSQRSNLHSHRRATHTDDRRYKCPDCPKRFKRRRLLDYHVKSCHTGERPLKCSICPSTFVYPEHFRKHARVHSGLKPFVCEICGKSFNSRDNRNTHRFVHSDKKPYECYVCGSGYMRKNTLYGHMQATGHLAESIVVNQPRVENVDDKIILESITLNDDEVLEEEEEDEEIEFSEIAQKSDGNKVTGEGETAVLTLNLGDNLKADGLLEASINQAAEDAQGNSGGDIRIVQIELPDGNNGWVAINSWKK